MQVEKDKPAVVMEDVNTTLSVMDMQSTKNKCVCV